MVTLTAHMFGRTTVTDHETIAGARERITAIAIAQSCRIAHYSDTAGSFVPQVWAGDHRVDDPRCPALGTFDFVDSANYR